MIWLDDDVVYLSCAEELSMGYMSHTARESQFSVPQPYQGKPQQRDDGEDLARGSDSCAVGEGVVVGVKSSRAEKSRRTGRKRKSTELRSDEQRQSREHEAQRRHMMIHDLLIRAHSMVLQWAQKKLGPSPDTPSTDTTDTALVLPSPVSMVADGPYEKLDLVTLSHMKQAMRPKFASATKAADAQPRDLFDQLISNDSEQDLIADAAGHPVILPPKSQFLISDITRLKPLLTGMEHIILLQVEGTIESTTMTGGDSFAVP